MFRAKGWRIVIVDPKKDWQGRGKEKKPLAKKPENSTVDSPYLTRVFRPDVPVQLFQPVEWDDSCDAFCAKIMEVGNTIIYFDEITQLVDATRVPMRFKILWTQGRSINVGAWCGTQRPLGIPLVVKDQAELWFIFRIANREDRKVVDGYIPTDETPQLVDQALPYRYFWFYSDVLDKPILYKPLTLKGKATHASA